MLEKPIKAERRSAPQALQTKLWSIVLLTGLAIAAQGCLYGATGDWTNVGPESGSFRQLVADPQNPDIIYATTNAGLFKSKDGGASWDNAGLNGFAVYPLAVDPQQPNILYAAATNSRYDENGLVNIFKSTDGGASWNESDSGLPGCCVGLLAIDPQNTGTLYALNGPSPPFYFGPSTTPGLFRSTDAGASWRMVYAPSDGFRFVDMAIDPKNAGTLYVAAQGHGVAPGVALAVFKSVDGGTSWREADAGLQGGFNCFNCVSFTIDPANPTTVYITIPNGNVYKTTDGAESWDTLSRVPIQPPTDDACCVSAVVIDPQDSNTLYAAYEGQLGAVFKSTDAGATWNASGPVPFTTFPSKSVTVDPRNSGILYAAALDGMYKSTDGGVTFALYSRARALPVTSIALSPQRSDTVLAGAGQHDLHGAFVFQSTDAGMSWRATDLGDDGWGVAVVAMAIDPQNPSIAYAGTGDSECGWALSKIFRSEDGGASWTDTQSGVDCLSSIVVDPRTAGTVYAASLYAGFSIYRGIGLGPGVKKSTDGGMSWRDVSTGLPATSIFEPAVSALAIDPRNTHTLFASDCAGSLCVLFKSTDGGAHWVGTKPGVPAFRDNEVVAMAVDPQIPNTLYAAIAPFDSRNGGLWKSIDGGANWRNVFPANVYAVAVNPQNPATIYIGVDGGLARSMDGGENWTMIPGGPGRVTVLALDPQDPDTVYAGGQGGLFAIRFAQ
jgi:photosystem II stability/assembly factor-like uncharacterized protein